jgi:hypothetical protein
MAVWEQINPLSLVGGPSGGASEDVTVGGLGASQVLPATHPLSPDHPLFWAFVIIGVTVGLIGVSTHMRVGPFRAGFSAGGNT